VKIITIKVPFVNTFSKLFLPVIRNSHFSTIDRLTTFVIILSTMVGKLANKLKELREERGWSQQELAKHSGIDRSTIAYLETDRIASPSAETFIKLAQAFNIHINELFIAAGYLKELSASYYYEETPEKIVEDLKLK